MAPVLEDRWREHDWVLSLGSNVHASNHRDWFVNEDFTMFESSVGEAPHSMEVKGIGTVKLELDHKDENASVHTLVLENVLYIPSLICNVIGLPIVSQQGYEYHVDLINFNLKLTAAGDVIGNFDKDPLVHIRLHGHAPGSSIFDQEVAGKFRIKVTWPATEQCRWKAFKAGEGYDPGSPVAQASFTAEEITWVKKNYRSEFKFLQSHHLSIHNQEERSKGVMLAREEMKKQAKKEKTGTKVSLLETVLPACSNILKELKEVQSNAGSAVSTKQVHSNIESDDDKENQPPNDDSTESQLPIGEDNKAEPSVMIEAKAKTAKYLPPHVRINLGMTID